MEQDHLWHPENTAEWWYFTGIGKLGDVERVNFHVAFFRKFSRTFKKHFWFAHFGLWDGEKFHFQRKYDIDNSGGSSDGCYVGEWELNFKNPEISAMVNNGDWLVFTPQKSPVWHADSYYSITDINVHGALLDKNFNGVGWFDHSFFDASVKELLNLKYTWIAIQLEGGIEIMVQWSSREPYFLGTIVYPKGSTRSSWKIKRNECFRFDKDFGWILDLPGHKLNLELHKRVENRVQGGPEPGYIEGILDVPDGVGYFEIAEGGT